MSNKEEKEQQGRGKAEGKVGKVEKVVSTVKFVVKYWKVILIVVAAIVVTILLAGAYYHITEWNEEQTNDAKQATISRAYSSNASTTETDDEGNEINKVVVKPNLDFTAYEIAYNDTDIEETKKELAQETSITISNFTDFEIGVLGALMDNGADLDYYTEEQLHCLPLFIKAENSTQNLDLRPNSEKLKDEDGDGQVEYVPQKREDLEENEVPGIILVQRTNTEAANRNQEPIVLEYINETDFNDKINNHANEVNTGSANDPIKYFTVNDKGELVYATWSYELVDTYDANDSSKEATYPSKLSDEQKVEEKDEYKLSTNKIAYEEYVKEYIMPFEFLVQLLVISTEPEFCTELVDHVLDSKIIINIQEEENITEEYETREYDEIEVEKDKIRYKVYLEGKENQPEESGTDYYIINEDDPEKCTTYNSKKYYVQIDKTRIQHTYKWELLEVDNWIVHLTKEYGEIKEKTTGGTPTSDATPQEIYSDSSTIITTEMNKHVEAFIEETEEKYNNNNNQVNTAPEIKTSIVNLESGIGYKIVIEGYESKKYTTNLPPDKNYTTEGVYREDLPASIQITLTDTQEKFKYTLNNYTQTDPHTNVTSDVYTYEFSSRESSKYECEVSVLEIEKKEKIDMKRTNMSSTTTKYEADSNPKTEKKYYATDTNKPGSGHGDKDTKYEKFLLAYDNNSYTRNQINSADSWLYEMMEKRESTVELIDTVKYLLHMYDGRHTGVTELEGYEGFEDIFSSRNFTSTGRVYGNSVEEKIWFALRAEGYSEIATAAVMGNLYKESGLVSNNLQNDYEIGGDYSLGYTDETYTEAIDNGKYSRDQFINDSAGYGLAQWTYYTLKEELYDYAKSKGVSIANEDMQIECLINQISEGGVIYDRNGFTRDDWEKATSPEDASVAFCWLFENPSEKYADLPTREQAAKDYYDKYKGKTKPEFSGDTVVAAGYEYPHYLQYDYPGSYGTSTIPDAGCGPTSLAMVLAGLTNNPAIDPYTVVDDIKQNWPGGSYYVDGVGSSWCIFENSFLNKYYEVSSEEIGSYEYESAMDALEEGYPIIGGEPGHFLVILPPPDEYKTQGYKFYILDSAMGHDGPYKSVDEANAVVGDLRVNFIIRPL